MVLFDSIVDQKTQEQAKRIFLVQRATELPSEWTKKFLGSEEI